MKIMTRSLVGMLMLSSGDVDDDDGGGGGSVSAEHSLFRLACCRCRRLFVDESASSKSNVANPDGAVHPRTSPGLKGFA